MYVKQFAGQEKIPAELISVLAFHGKVEDLEKSAAQWVTNTSEDWGAFTDDGVMMARVVNNHFDSFVSGKLVMNGGIGAVSTLPEYRNTGAVRSIFASLLPAAYDRGEVISTLYPFNHAFYRKFGYETVCHKNEYKMDVDVIRGYRFEGDVKLWMPGDPVTPYTELYNAFAKDYEMMIARDDERMARHLGKEPWYKKREFTYMLSENGENLAYITFRDEPDNGERMILVDDIAWLGRKGFKAILGFLARFTADYKRLNLSLPVGIDLLHLVRSPRQYDIEKIACQGYMLRVVNAFELLKAIKKSADTDFVIKVTDEIITQNNASYRVTADGVVPTDAQADIEADVRALGQMAIGAVTLREAMLRDDVTVHGKEEMLSQVFARKDRFVMDHF